MISVTTWIYMKQANKYFNHLVNNGFALFDQTGRRRYIVHTDFIDPKTPVPTDICLDMSISD